MKRNEISRIRNAVPELGRTGDCVPKAYDFLEQGEELEINMYGEVVEDIPVDWWTGERVSGMYICEKDFLDDLGKYQGKSRITVRINSVGGDLYAGLAIANRLKEMDAEIITIADALVASAAVAIYQAGNTRKIFSGSQIMIHEPSCFIYGRYDLHALDKVQKQLEAGKKSLINSYAERTGRTEEDLENLLSGDCWMTGKEAVDEGFADEVIEGEVSAEITEDKKVVVSNGIRFAADRFQTLPRHLKTTKNTVKNPVQGNGGKEEMTRQEIKEKYPDIYNEIIRETQAEQSGAVSKAVEQERKRLREIDEIANAVGDENLIREAKYGEKTMNASELALLALRKQSEERKGILKDMGEETAVSGAEEVLPTPNSGTKSKEEQALQDVMDGAALIAGIQKGEKA